MQTLIKSDSDIKQAFNQIGLPPERESRYGFEALLSIIISQQISTKAAEAIKGRVLSLTSDLTAASLLDLDEQSLRDAGLSWRKVEYAKDLARAVVSGKLNIDELTRYKNDDVITAITGLRGFGRWSAEIYLMFSLKRLDVFPADDLAILISLGHLKKMKEKPTPTQARKIVASWAPNRSIGALFLWHYYHQLRQEK